MDKKESKFSGSLLGYAWVNIVYLASIILTANILMPFGLCYRERWMADHTIINGKQMKFNGSGTILFVKKRIIAIISPILLATAATLFFTRDKISSTGALAEYLFLATSILFLLGYIIFTIWYLRGLKKWVIKNTTFVTP